MKVQLLSDKTGNPTHAVVPYDDWIKIETILNGLGKGDHKKIEKKDNVDGLSWYVATETFSSIMNSLIAHYNRELLNVRELQQTEEYKLLCKRMLHELHQINKDSSITDSLDKMNEYIGKYGPMIKKINLAA